MLEWIEDNFAKILVIGGTALLLPLQTWLCFKVKRLWLRLLPVIFFTLASAVMLVFCLNITGWDVLVYLVFLIYALFLLGICVLGWAIWGVVKLIRRTKKNKNDCH